MRKPSDFCSTVCSVLLLGSISLAPVSFANATTYTTVDISPIANFTMEGANPLFPTGAFVTPLGVPFDINTGINTWGSGDGIGGGGGNDGHWSASLDVFQSNVKTIYTLADTLWGTHGLQWFSLTANFDNGKSLTWKYTDGEQLRDWNLYYADSVNGTDSVEVFRVSPPNWVRDGNSDVLDMQALAVPAEFQSATLNTLVLTDNRQTFVHSAFVSGITLSDSAPVTLAALSPVPEPETAAMLLAGLALIGARRTGKKATKGAEATLARCHVDAWRTYS